MPCARTRSFSGSQVVNALVTFGKATRLAGAEEEPRYGQREEVPGPTGGGGEETPPQHDAREHAARPHAVAQVAAGDFEEGVGPAEGGEDRAHLTLVQPQVLAR